MYQRSRTSWFKHLDFMAVDLLCLNIAACAAWLIRNGGGQPYLSPEFRLLILVMSCVQFASSAIRNSFSGVLRRGYLVEFGDVAASAAIILAFSSLFIFAAKYGDDFSRLFLFNSGILFVVLAYCGRLILKKAVNRRLARKASAEPGPDAATLFIVSDTAEHAAGFIADIKGYNLNAYRISGIALTDEVNELSKVLLPDVPVFGDLKAAADYICREWIDEVAEDLTDETELDAFNEACSQMGITVHKVLDIHEVMASKQFIEKLGGHTVVTTAYNYITPFQGFFKRAMDIIGGIIGSIFAVVIGIIIGPMIYIASPGPIIFRQRRIGRNGKQFYVLKFRSMYLDAEDRKKELITDNRVSDGMMFKLDFDPRVIGNRILPDGTKKTGIGEFIRRTSLDEFPQFFNVLRGDMSLVGTRPPTVDEWEKYEYHHRARMAMKPGITGLWQVSGRSEVTDFEEVVRLDTEYICNYHIASDIRILFKTIAVLIKRKGAM